MDLLGRDGAACLLADKSLVFLPVGRPKPSPNRVRDTGRLPEDSVTRVVICGVALD